MGVVFGETPSGERKYDSRVYAANGLGGQPDARELEGDEIASSGD